MTAFPEKVDRFVTFKDEDGYGGGSTLTARPFNSLADAVELLQSELVRRTGPLYTSATPSNQRKMWSTASNGDLTIQGRLLKKTQIDVAGYDILVKGQYVPRVIDSGHAEIKIGVTFRYWHQINPVLTLSSWDVKRFNADESSHWSAAVANVDANSCVLTLTSTDSAYWGNATWGTIHVDAVINVH